MKRAAKPKPPPPTIRIKSQAVIPRPIKQRKSSNSSEQRRITMHARPDRYDGMSEAQKKEAKARMLLLLALPRMVDVSDKKKIMQYRRMGLPLNSLPGWENIPLNCKLPMLKCPGNEVVFTKNKLGKDFKRSIGEFDLSTNLHDKPEYNSLHDTNLKNFYSREVNRVRLRLNGEITPNNDVICTLKDFNAFRIQLHQGQLYHVLQTLSTQRQAQYDHSLVVHAQDIMDHDHSNLLARHGSRSVIMARKKELENAKAEHMKKLQQRTVDRLKKFYMERYLSRKLLEHRKMLRQMDIERHWEIRDEILRKRFILLKKFLTIKKYRTERNLRRIQQSKEKKDEESVALKWHQRLNERIALQKQITEFMADERRKRHAAIQAHLNSYKKIWARIQAKIKQRTLEWQLSRQPKRKPKKPIPEVPTEDYLNYLKILELMPHQDLADAIQKAVSLSTEENKYALPFLPEDPIYNAAKFILKFTCEHFKENMLGNKAVYNHVATRVRGYLEEVYCYVGAQAARLIRVGIDKTEANAKNEEKSLADKADKADIFFGNTLQVAEETGAGYPINPLVTLKSVSGRPPTPIASLTSIPVDELSTVIEEGHAINLATPCTLFLEYHLLKFKRELTVAVKRIVFQAIKCHEKGKIMGVRRELLEIEHDYLVDMVTTGLAGYAVNDLNFKSSLKLCISAIAAQVIDKLQESLLKPKRDPRAIIPPNQCCGQGDDAMLCLYCD